MPASSPSGKRIAVYFLLIIGLFILSSNKRPAHKKTGNGAIGRWTGTITFKESMTGQVGNSERTITASFANAIPNCYIDELNGQPDDDKGVGSHTYHGEGIIDGKKMGITDCSGNSQAQLLGITFNEEEGTYDIGMNSCECTGKAVSLLDGKVDDYGPEVRSVDIFKQPLGPNHNILDGTQVQHRDIGTVATVTLTTTWHLERIQDDVELIITPVDYDKWLPEPGINENSYGTEITIDLKLQGKHGKQLTQKADSFVFRLNNTSREPGMTINYPLTPANPALPDLRFLPQQNSNTDDEFQVMTVNCNNGCTTASVKVDAFDGGAYSTLTAMAYLKDGRIIKGNLLVSGGPLETTLPKRNGSVIAQSWLDAHGKPGDYDDKETSRSNYNNGDGLSAYEEYRGVIAEGKFKRLDPKRKELCVAMGRTTIPRFEGGIKLFESASDIDVVKMYIHELDSSRKLNKNFATAHVYDQYGLMMVTGVLPDGAGGHAYSALSNEDPTIPAHTPRVIIDLLQLHNIYYNFSNSMKPKPLPFTEDQSTASTVAHELAHAVSVFHHGDLDPIDSAVIDDNTFPITHIYDDKGFEIKKRPFTVKGTIGIEHCQESGDVSCFMAYNPYYNWSYQKLPNGDIEYRLVPLFALGTKLCTSQIGTGINAGGKYFGNAKKGNCMSQLQLK